MVRTAEADALPAASAQTIIETIVASGQTKIFVVDVDPAGGFTYAPLAASKAAERGSALNPACGLTPVEFFGPADGAAVAARYRECVLGGRPMAYEERLHALSEERWWLTSLTPIKGPGGRVIQILGVAQDVTERRRAVARLSQAERQFQSVIANIPGIVYRRVRDPDGGISYPYLSEGVGRLLGFEAAAAQSDSSLMLNAIDPRDMPAYQRALERSAAELSSFRIDMRARTAAGEERWFRSLAQASRMEDGGTCWDGVILDITEQKRAEAQALEREDRLRDFTEAASDWLWESDAELRFTRMSDRFFAIYGVRIAKLLGKRWDDIAEAEDGEAERQRARIFAERLPFRDLVMRCRIGGSPAAYVKIGGQPVFDDAGVFQGYRGTGTDLTAQRRAEERAATASSHLLAAIESLSEGVAIYDTADRLVLCNARYRGIGGRAADICRLGASFEEILRGGIAVGLYPAAIGCEEEWLRRRMLDHRAAGGSVEQQIADGHWLQILEQRTPDGGIIALLTDITEVKRRETALTMLAGAGQDGSGFFEEAVRSLAAGLGYRYAAVCEILEDGAHMTCLAFCDGAEISVGRRLDVAGAPAAEVLRRAGFLALSGGAAASHPGDALLASHGAEAFVGDIVTDVGGRPIGIVFAFDGKPDPSAAGRRDITGLIAARVSLELQRRDTEKQLRQAKEEAEIASRAKSEFLANMSHELRTPLNAVIGFAQMIGEEILGPIGRLEYKEYARDIHSSSLHLLQIINDILDVSKIEAGMLALHETPVVFSGIVAACIRLVAAKAQASEIALDTDLPDDLPVIWADERMLKQVTLNLLSNALKFTPKGGAVQVSARAHRDGGLVFTVADTGIGIAREDFEKIFRPFGQVDSSLNRRFEGTGLGLPLTKGLVELHGGTVTLESVVGEGTSVHVTLPRIRS